MKLSKRGNNPLLAISYLFKGLALVTHPKLRPFIVLPLIINLVLYTLALVLGYYSIHFMIAQFMPQWLLWLSWLIYPLFFIGFVIIGFFSFTVLANIIAAPFYAKLATQTLRLRYPNITITTLEPPFSAVMGAEYKRLRYMLSRLLPLSIGSFIPVINIITPPLAAVFGAWIVGLEYSAYTLENRGILFAEQKQQLQPIRVGILSFGGITMLGLALPVINIFIAPAAVIGATLYVQELSVDDE